MKSLIIITITLYALLPGQSVAQRLAKFASETGSLERNGGLVQAAYPDGANYFGFLVPDSGAIKAGHAKAFLYFRLREDVVELGIRIVSPIPEYVFPDKGDLTSEKYLANEQNKTTFFNPQFILSKAKGVSGSGPAQGEPSGIEWLFIYKNDQRLSSVTNNSCQAVMRIYDEKNKKNKPNKAGFYRLEISAADTVHLGGSFLVQLGTTSEFKSLTLTENEDGH